MTISSILLSLLLTTAQVPPASDTLFTWRSYAREGSARLFVYPGGPDASRPYTVILRELAENRGPSTTDDARHVVELIGRGYAILPEEAYWIFHWGSFSHPDASGRKDLFLRATFRRLKSGALSTPSWRVISREEVEDLTDRRYPRAGR